MRVPFTSGGALWTKGGAVGGHRQKSRGSGGRAPKPKGVRGTARPFDPDPDSLLAAALAPDELIASTPLARLAAGRETHTQMIRLLRPTDLVDLHVLVYRCRLQDGGEGPVLVPEAEGAWLEVRFPFQHVAERAWYGITTDTPETKPGGVPQKLPKDEVPTPPLTDARAAHGTRLVYDVPEDEVIAYSTEGILHALSRLPMRVPALATPRPEQRRLPAFGDVMAGLGGGLLLTRAGGNLIVRVAPTAWLRAATPDEPLVASIRAARDRITARRLLARSTAVDPRGVSGVFPHDIREPVHGRRPRRQARPPRADETAIEAPYRLFLSPSAEGGFTHSSTPVAAPTDERRVELWHSRLGVRTNIDGGWKIEERADTQRIVRAIWARDLDYYSDEQLKQVDKHPFDPFRTSLDPRDRRILVRQSAETGIAVPEPIDVRRLYLSSLGAWLDLHGSWYTDPYSATGAPAIQSWDHVAPMGRDQFVRVVYPGYLFPFGHRAALVKVTERKIKAAAEDPHAPQARLYQRKFIVVGEPVRGFEQNDMPFREVRIEPLATPDLMDPALHPDTPFVIDGQDLFWPVVAGQKFRFTLDCLDHDGRRVRLHVPLLFVASHLGARPSGRRKEDPPALTAIVSAYEADNKADAAGQWTAFAPSAVPGDTSVEVRTFRFTGTPEIPDERRATPRLDNADVVIPAARHLAPTTTDVTVTYPKTFIDDGFAAATEVFLAFANPLPITYGSGTDRAGGFVQPDLSPTQLSRTLGALGPLANNGADFDPQELLAGALPRLFGLFDLWEVLDTLGVADLPSFLTESLDRVSALVRDLQQLAATVQTAITRLQEDATTANAAVKARLDAARAELQSQQTKLSNHVETITTAFDDVLGTGASKTPAEVIAPINGAIVALKGVIDAVSRANTGAPLPPTLKAQLDRLVAATKPVLELADLGEEIAGFLEGIDPEGLSIRARYVWQPPMKPWPDQGPPVFDPLRDGFTLSIEARASASEGSAGLDVLAELRDFSLNLLPGAELMRMRFERIAFRASTGRKPETDVAFGGIEFLGVLGFIETLRELIPFDGFADPPRLDVSPEGVTAGFDLALPNAAVGVFSLENISLGADCRVPFLGDAVTVGFSFCTRERPFRITVMAIGGGGFVAIRLSPQGLVVLEMALEAGAALSLDFGVASGSVSVMVGIYLRLESDKGSLTGYFRIRGEVDVLGLISASITLELSLTYEFDTGKMVGRASIVVEVEVLLFSASVEITVERRLAGSNGDPTFAQIMDVTPGGTSGAWDEYCRAFAA